MTLNEQLEDILEIKNDIKTSIQGKGQSVTDFASYANAIDDISTGTVKTPKTLVILTSRDEQTDEQYDPDCGEDYTTITTDYFAPSGGINSSIDATDINDIDGAITISIEGGASVSESSMTDAWNYIYGTGTYITTQLVGLELVNYVNTLTDTYDLTIDEWQYDTLTTMVIYTCEEPEPEPEEEPEPDPEEGE